MTDFENNIKRNVSKKHFFNIMNEKYGDGTNTWDYTYGDVSSWFSWIRDEQERFFKHSEERLYFIDYNKKEWEKKKPVFWEDHPYFEKFLKRLATDILFLGENMAGDGTPPDWPPFTVARHHKNIIRLFIDTAAEGAYFTDLIKPDKRFLNKIGKPSNGEEVRRIVEKNQEILKEHFDIFKAELKFIGVEKPLLVIFGDAVEYIMNIGINEGYIKKEDFIDIIKIKHYSKVMNFYKYAEDTSVKLKDYLTIPCDKETLTEKWKRHGLPPMNEKEEGNVSDEIKDKKEKKKDRNIGKPHPPLREILDAIKKRFRDEKYEMSEKYKNNPWRASEPHTIKKGDGEIGFCIVKMRRDDTNEGPAIWQILWQNFNVNGIYKPKLDWFKEKEIKIKELGYKDCYISEEPMNDIQRNIRFKLWIPASNQEDPIKSLLEIVQNTKDIMGY